MAEASGTFLPLGSPRRWAAALPLTTLLLFFLAAIASFRYNFLIFLIWLFLYRLIVRLFFIVTQTVQKRPSSRRVKSTLPIISAILLCLIFLSGITTIISAERTRQCAYLETYQYADLTFYIYIDPLPLQVEDLLEIDGRWTYERRHNETLLLSSSRYLQRPLLTAPIDLPSLEYTIVDVKLPALYTLCQNDQMQTYAPHPPDVHSCYIPIDASPWKATDVYQRSYRGLIKINTSSAGRGAS